ncbi:MAG: S8 family peptidase [Pseudomonadota bacterium]
MRLKPISRNTHPKSFGITETTAFTRFCRVSWALPAAFLWISGTTPVSAQGFAVSYNDPNLCVASVLFATGRQLLETPDRDLTPAAPPSSRPPQTRPDDIPDCVPVPGLTSVPGQPAAVATAPTPKPPRQAGKDRKQPSETSKSPDEDQPDEKPELGLVKAQDTLVSLILVNEDDGQPLQGATVRLLAAEPDLPGGTTPDADLTDTENYAAGVEGDELGDDGQLLLSVATQPEDDLAGIKLTEVSEDQSAADAVPADKPEVTRTARVVRQNPQLVVATAANWTRLPVELAPPGAKVCVNRNFRIGDNNIHVVSLPGQYIAEFTRNAGRWQETEFVEADPCRNKEENKDPLYETSGLWGQKFDNQWAIKRVGFEEEKLPQWPSKPTASTDVTVAVIDTGLDWYHPDIDHDKIWTNPNEVQGNGIDDDKNGYVDDIVGWNFVRNRNKPWDYDGHGTFVTGVIAAAQNNGIGISGISSSAKIMPLKALDAFGRGYASMAAEAINYAAEHGARIINLSLGGRTLTKVEQLAIDHARSKGAIVVVAAGNSGKSVADFSPAGLRGVVTVTATDRNDRRAGFSNWGPLVDIAAPGVDVLSLRARRTDLLSLIRGVKYKRGEGILGEDRSYYRASGTSFATPIVTGTITELLAGNPELTAEQATRMVLHSARDIETPGVDNYTGYGLLDATAALAADPEYFNESRISGVKVVTRSGKPVLRVLGTSNTDDFKEAVIRLGKGPDPKKWLEVNRKILKPVNDALLIELPAGVFKGARQWTIRLITRHKNGAEREARFSLKLG